MHARVFVLLALSPLFAQVQASPDDGCCEHSKLTTQDADPLGRGAAQVQLNYGFTTAARTWNPDGDRERRERFEGHGPQVVVTYGVSDALDLGIGQGYAWLQDGDLDPHAGQGWTDLTLSAKWRVAETEQGDFGLALLPTLTVPTGEESSDRAIGPGAPFWNLDFRAAAVKDWSHFLSTNIDVGGSVALGDRGDTRGGVSANVALGWRLIDWFQPEVEVGYAHTFAEADDADLLTVTAGVVVAPCDRTCLRVGVQRGVAGANVDQGTTGLLSLDINF